MEFTEVVVNRRSVRQFVPCEIDEAVVTRILEAGRLAPSGCNMQDREFIVIRDRDTLTALHDTVQPVFRDVPAAIALVMNPVATAWGSYWVEDAAAATENMLLAIVNEGYDSVWVEGTLLAQETWAKDLLGVPEDKRLYVLLPIGKAAQPGSMAAKPELASIVFRDRYGQRTTG